MRAAPLLLALVLPVPAVAILEEPPVDAPAPAAALCVGGTVWYAEGATCVDPALGLVADDLLYAEVRRNAHAGRYREAALVLAAMRETGTPRVLTAEGFILRRTGQVAEGLGRYAEALALDPGYHMARAYWGLWFLEEGDREGAAAMLADIVAEGGEGSEAWRLLSAALAAEAPAAD
jgi:Flp pilus assembly protein TadD